jgi:hypothetical protein
VLAALRIAAVPQSSAGPPAPAADAASEPQGEEAVQVAAPDPQPLPLVHPILTG